MGFDVLLEILRTFEGLSTELALVGLEGYMDTDMRCDMVALDGGGPTASPTTGEVQVIGTLTTDVTLADVILAEGQLCSIRRRVGSYVKEFRRRSPLTASIPLALKGIISATLLNCWGLLWSWRRRGGLGCF